MKDDESEMLDDIIAAGETLDRSFEVLTIQDKNVKLCKHTPKYVISGDTDSSYIDLSSKFPKNTQKETVIAFADNLAKQVNARFTDFMMNVFNTSETQAQTIKTERDVISDKSYFVGKKNYILHYVNKEGVDIEDYKVMGLATKRTDHP